MGSFKRVSPDLTTDAVVESRLAAFCLDVAVVTLVSLVVAVALTLEQVTVGPAALVWFVTWFSYVVVAQGRYGQTVGKYVVGVVVTTADGGPVGYREAAVRELVRVADLLTLNAVGWVVTPGNRRQRLGDLAAGTVVVPAAREARRL
ncbi:RDD family protein [Halomarina oriensis]|uniref:RDD domain-containing protein n=1 Tax=Halomarina oriensis TaxID=671145 RepID=A0A6B0GPT8_9EURY|nr:RDD family protein [Halomarina oriensis]MWG33658.1 hypothetical protein [Halomarina oriensis]